MVSIWHKFIADMSEGELLGEMEPNIGITSSWARKRAFSSERARLKTRWFQERMSDWETAFPI